MYKKTKISIIQKTTTISKILWEALINISTSKLFKINHISPIPRLNYDKPGKIQRY